MNLLPSRLAQAWQLHHGALPWVVLRKLLPGWCKTETLILLRQPLLGHHAVPAPRLAGLGIHRILSSHDPLLRKLCAAWPDKTFAARLTEPGHYCWVAVRAGRIAGYAWVSCVALAIDEIDWHYDLLQDECFIYDCFVDPACRGVGLYPYLLARVLQDCRTLDIGLQSAAIGVIATNHASLRGIRKAGFAVFARIRYLRWGGRRWWWGLPGREFSDPATPEKC